jgi:hypothetical protein
MKIPKDRLASLAQAQPNLPQSRRDRSVLEAARQQAAMQRKKHGEPVPASRSGFFGWLSKPMWVGSGSVLASLLVMFLVTGNPVVEDKTTPALPAASPAPTAPTAPTAPVVAMASNPATAPAAESTSTSERREQEIPGKAVNKPKLQESVELKKAPAMKASEASPPNASAPVADSPAASAPPVSAAPAPALAPVPSPAPAPVAAAAPAPSARVSAAMATAPQGLAKDASRKREEPRTESVPQEVMPESVQACIKALSAVPENQRTSQYPVVKRLVQHCVQQFPKTEWPDNLLWIKQLNMMEPSNVEPEPSK